MRPVDEAIAKLKHFLDEYRRHKKKEIFKKKDFLEEQLVKTISALNEFDKVKYAPESEEDDARDKAVRNLRELLTNVEWDHVPFVLSSIFEEIQDIINENLAYYTPGKVLCYWRGSDEAISSKPPGIGILCNDDRPVSNRNSGDLPLDFKEQVIKALNYIALTPTGNILLADLCNDPKGVVIYPTPLQRSNVTIPRENEKVMNQVAHELIAKSTKRGPGEACLQALYRAANNNNVGINKMYSWLAEQINKMPKLTGKVQTDETVYLKMPLLSQQLQKWFEGDNSALNDYSPEVIDHITNGIIIALHPYSDPGPGSGSVVFHNCFPDARFNQQRPPAIGLAHELIHAYCNAKGIGPSYPDPIDEPILGEYIVLGLGPWKDAPVTENLIRNQWNAILSKIPKEDTQHHKTVGPRTGTKPLPQANSNDNSINTTASPLTGDRKKSGR